MQRLDKLRNMLAKTPDDVFLNFSLAMEFMATGATDDARRQFERTIELDPDYLAAYQRLGELLIREKRFDEARGRLETARDVAERAGDRHMADNIREMLDLLP